MPIRRDGSALGLDSMENLDTGGKLLQDGKPFLQNSFLFWCRGMTVELIIPHKTIQRILTSSSAYSAQRMSESQMSEDRCLSISARVLYDFKNEMLHFSIDLKL